MSKDANKAILQKIKKLLALAQSPNEHEAALALSKAQELMEAHSISESSILTIDIEEAETAATVRRSPAHWEMSLVALIRRAFGCQSFLYEKNAGTVWVFIGSAPTSEIAAYAFQTLCRQVKKARRKYLSTLKRCKPKTKTERGNLFCQAWVWTVHNRVHDFAGQDRREAINGYLEKNHPNLEALEARGKSPNVNSRNVGAYAAGIAAGKAAHLHHGVGGAAAPVPALTGGV